ncbi:MAG: IS6 family transposase [Thermovenabulum sp.]|uniref:IS6 family transposase n=1 Tax=Thermovenabulum sp. TaxID=3100335 RepID=UPI003C7B6CFB
MFRQPLPVFLLTSLLNFLLKIFLFTAKHFKVDIEPPAELKSSTYKILSPLKDPLPIVEKKDYREILAEAEAAGKPISPVRRIKPLSVDIDKCPVCGAPAEYLYSFGKDPEGFQKLQCKVCKHQWAPGKPAPKKSHPTYRCPLCGYALIKVKTRKNFSVFKCCNDNCPKWLNHRKRYRFRAFDVNFEELSCSSPTAAPVNLANSRFSSFLIAQCVNFYVGLGLSLRQTVFAVKHIWQVQISYETVHNWVVSLASKLAPFVRSIHLPLSGIVVIDETYIKVKGKWHYLFTAFDGLRGFIISQHLSPHRDALAALTILKEVIERYNNREFILVTDKAPIYEVAVYSASVFFNASIRHRPVLGISIPPGGDPHTYRPYKNRIERLFGSYKAHYKRHKSFSSFEGAVAHALLYQLYYNHLKPHDACNGDVPVPLIDKKGRQVDNWAKLIQWFIESYKA